MMKKIGYIISAIWCLFTWLVTPIWLKYTFLNLTGLIYQHDPTMDEGTAWIFGMIMLVFGVIFVFLPNYMFLKRMFQRFNKEK